MPCSEGMIIQILLRRTFKTNYSGQAWLLYPQTCHLQPKMKALIALLTERLGHEPTLAKPMVPYEIPSPGCSCDMLTRLTHYR